MLRSEAIMSVIWVLIFCLLIDLQFSYGQYFGFDGRYAMATLPLPFPPCKAVDVDCLRRGIRTFFFLMDSEYIGMKPVDPILMNSVSVTYPDQGLSFMTRRLNVTGARWTKLVDRRFNLQGNKSGVQFQSDLHVTAEILMKIAERYEPFSAFITMDIAEIESNITYSWNSVRGVDNEDYLVIGQERIAVRNSKTPTYFLQKGQADAVVIDQALQNNPTMLEYISIEIVTSLMHSIFDNFQVFATSIPVKYYYQYN